MPRKQKGPVFRVSGLPAQQSDEELDTALRAAITENLSDKEAEHSFTTAIVPSCNDDSQRVALVEFHDGVPDFLHDLVSDPLKDWQIEMGDDDINFDRHFFGFTQLYTPDSCKPISADIIAITGLDGHAYGSWRSKGNLGRMWLRDFLSTDMPSCRTMIYGYNSKLSSHGISKIMDYGRELVEELKKVRSSEEARKRPLFFIAHSFGGIILAHCLIKAVQTNEDDHPTIAALHKATYGMLLFGIPHKGLVVNDIQNMLGDGNHPRSSLLQQVSKESDLLASQLVDFKNLIRDRKVVSFYETGQTKKLEFNTEKKRWERTGDFVTAVDTDSALLQLPDSLEEKLPVDADHSMIVKFDNKNSKAYVSARDKLKQFEKDAPKVIAARFVKVINGPKPTIMIPFQQDPGFVGREGIITDIYGHHATDHHSRVALTGLGGVGKSQIAIEYAYRFRVSSPQTWVFWIHAANTSRFEESYRAIADKVEMPGRVNPEIDILQAVHNWLADERNGQWLMILDNVDDDGPFFDQERPLEKFLPQTPNGNILITSRNKAAAMNLVGPSGHLIRVEPMGEDEALDLLSTRVLLDESNRHDARRLVKVLEYIPLAISHAAAYIKASALMTMSDYLKRFEESEANILNVLKDEKDKDIRRDNSIRHAVTATWEISFAQITETEPFAAQLLALMSMLDRQGIPLCLLRKACQHPDSLETKLTVLVDFSLVKIEIGNQSAGMHRLVQLCMKKWLKAGGQIKPQNELSTGMYGRLQLAVRGCFQAVQWAVPATKQLIATSPSVSYDSWARAALKLLATIYPIDNLGDQAICRMYLPHAYAVLRNDDGNVSKEEQSFKAHLSFHIARYLHQEGRYKEAEQLADNALIIHKAVLGPENPRNIFQWCVLGRIYAAQCRWKDAEQLFVRSMEIGKKNFGDLHIGTIEATSDLSLLYYEQGRYEEAEDLAVQALEARKKAFGNNHEKTLVSTLHLGLVYRTRGRLEMAETLMLQSLEGCKEAYGDKDHNTQEARVILGSIYLDQGKLKEAEELLLRAMACLVDAMGEDHPRTLRAMQQVTVAFICQQRWEEAERLGTRVLTAISVRLGEGHPETLKIMHYLSCIYSEQGQLERAKEISTRVLKLRRATLGEEHPVILSTLNILALICFKLNDEEEVQLWDQLEELGRRVLGPDNRTALAYKQNVAIIRKKYGRVEEAVALMKECAERRQEVLGRDHPDTLGSLLWLMKWEEEASKCVPSESV